MAQPVAILTGAGGGIGRTIAVGLDRKSYSTVLVGRTESTLRETASLLRQGTISPADITKMEDVERVVEKALSSFGRIDALINNAGIAPVLPIEQTTPQIWHEVIDTNLSAAYYFCRAAWPTFKKQGAGVVVNISSMAAKDPFPGLMAYGAAKAGLNNLGLSLAREGSAIGVRVYTIAPGAVETQMLRNFLSAEQFPEENTLKPAEVAQVVLDCVQGNSRYKSGEVVWLAKENRA